VNLEDQSQIVRIDSKALKVTATWSLAPGEHPSGLAIDPKTRRLFSVCSNHKMIVMDADNGAIVADVLIGSRPDAAGFDPSTNLAFSSNGGDGTLTVVHEDAPDKFTVVQNVPTKRGARTMAVDTTTHTVYLATAEFAAPTTQPTGERQRRPRMIPDTFMILVADSK
jgi:DNA-binding beta-propeller fold protein YncE